MRPLLINIFLFLACITVFWLAAPQIPTADKHNSNSSIMSEPVKETPKDSTSMLWKKDSTLQATADFFPEKTAY